MRKAAVLAVSLFLAVAPALADVCGFSFLRLPLQPRAAALGEAVAAMADDASAPAYNPAGLALVRTRTASAGYLSYVAGIQAGQLSYLHPWGGLGAAGITLSYLNSGSITETTLDMPAGTGNTFSFTSTALALSYGRIFSPQMYAGASAKAVYEKAQEYTASAAAVDLGALYEVDLEALSQLIFKDSGPRSLGTSLALGASVQNLGAATSAFIETKEKLPLTVRLGLAYRPFLNRVALALGGVKVTDSPAKFQAGLEYRMLGLLALRAGYNGVQAGVKNGSSIDDLSGFACGLGVRWRGYMVNSAYTPFAGLGHPLRFEMSAEF